MVRSGFSHTQGSVWSWLGATAIGLAAFAATWLLLAPATIEPPAPVAVVRRQASGDDQLEPLVADALRIESLRSLIDETGLLANGAVDRKSDLADWARRSLRVEIGEVDRAGKQAISIRWVGEPATSGAAQLVNVLARRLADQAPTRDVRSLERQLNQAHAEAAAAERAVARARQQFDAALAAVSSHSQLDAGPPPTPQPRPAPVPESSDHAGWLQSRQQLVELERRREVLAERLMPEHPEMKAIDEKIDVLRSALNNQPTPAPAVADAFEPAVESPLPAGRASIPELAQVEQLGREVVAAQQQYDRALAAERTCWKRLAETPTGTLTEIEPALETPQLAVPRAGWQRWLVSSVAALAFGGLAFVLWPGRQQIFRSVEEVRASTRLPVVVVDRVMLN